MIAFVSGDLLAAKVEALVNPVNTVGVMGKGLALAFKKAFPANFKAYEAAAKAGVLAVGSVFVFEAVGLVNPRYILNFPTKAHWRDPSKLSYVEDGSAISSASSARGRSAPSRSPRSAQGSAASRGPTSAR